MNRKCQTISYKISTPGQRTEVPDSLVSPSAVLGLIRRKRRQEWESENEAYSGTESVSEEMSGKFALHETNSISTKLKFGNTGFSAHTGGLQLWVLVALNDQNDHGLRYEMSELNI